MIILDTNIVSEVTRPKPDLRVLSWFEQELPELYICGLVVMEQTFGAERFLNKTGSDRYLRILTRTVEVQFAGRVIEFAAGAPPLAGKLRARRESIGRPMSILDAMIAAICLANGATLATRNVRDFDGLDLKLVNPFEAAA